MDSKTKDILERFAQRLIDSNARSRTYFLGQIKSTDTIDLYSYAQTFNPQINLGPSILKKNKMSFPYVSITPTKIKEILQTSSKKEEDLKNLIYGISEKDLKQVLNTKKVSEYTPLCDKYNEINRSKYLHIDILNQNAKLIEKETGRSELYIGYPFIEGTFFSGKVYRAPLLLHEVEIQTTPNLKTIKFTNEVYINPVFMISYGIENKMPHQRFDFDLEDSKDLLGSTTKYIKEKLSLDVSLTRINKLIPFNSCTKVVYENKHKLYPGEFKVTNNAVLGIFPISSKSIYYDIKSICEADEVNSLLKKFLSKRQKDTLVDEYFNQENDQETNDDKIDVIGEADISQKQIIRDSIEKNLVIQGPPGTGKSQTIVNIIASNVSKGKTVLVVSEKKTAIDVIYNRLDKLSRFSVILRNISTDKTNFYKQLIETLNIVKQINPNEDKKRSLVYTKNKQINKFFNSIHAYSNILSTDYDGYTFSEIASCCRYNLTKEMHVRFKSLIENYDSFSSAIEKFFDSDYIEVFNKLKKELIDFKTYSLLHFDIVQIERAKIIMTLNISRNARKYLINRLYYNLPLNDYFIPKSVFFKGVKLNEEVKNVFKVLEEEILKLNLGLFLEKDNLYKDFILLEFLSKYDYTKDELIAIYKRILFENVSKENKELFKFFSDYEKEENTLSKAIKDKEKLCLENILSKLVSRIVKESTTNREIFEGIKELERLSNLQRRKSIPFVVSKNFKSLLTMYPVWLLTPEVASSILPVSKELFDVVVFDEASQIFIENATGVLFRAKRAIVVGDTKQLRPSSVFQSRYVEDEFVLDSKKMSKSNVAALEEESLLDYASYKYLQRTLRYHYRSEHKNLIEFSNASFYENKLFFASSNTQYYKKPLEVINCFDGLWKDNTNIVEARRVVLKIIELVKTKRSSDSLGVITFNEQQRKLISDLVLKEASSNESDEVRDLLNKELNRIDEKTLEDTSLFIKNIENVQGDERDIIIFSITYAKNSENQLNSNFGLLSMANGENRLNVAITRAKKKIVIVKSFNSSELKINQFNKGPFYFKKYLEYCELVSNNLDTKTLLKTLYQNTEETSEVIKSDHLKEDLLVRLSKKLDLKKYKLIQNYSAGTFNIDIAIFDLNLNKCLLAIKTESSLKEEKSFDRENDYYCDKYLKNRGIKIKRIFSCTYFKNPQAEINLILENF